MVKTSTLLKLHILSLLKKQQHGYNLINELKKNFDSISPGQVYPFLKQLKRENFISLSIKTVNGRKTKIYKLTKKGHKLFDSITKKMEYVINTIIKSKITKCFNCGCVIYGEHYKINIRNKKFRFCCKHCADNYLKEKKKK